MFEIIVRKSFLQPQSIIDTETFDSAAAAVDYARRKARHNAVTITRAGRVVWANTEGFTEPKNLLPSMLR